jgi:hypothetical protein
VFVRGRTSDQSSLQAVLFEVQLCLSVCGRSSDQSSLRLGAAHG